MRRPTYWERLTAPSDWPRWRPRSAHVMCPECGRHGFPGGTWADACLRNDHSHECSCGRRFPSPAAASAHARMTREGDHVVLDTKSEA